MQHYQHSEHTGFTQVNWRSFCAFGDTQLPSRSCDDFRVRFLARSALVISLTDLASKYWFVYKFLVSIAERDLSVSLTIEDEKC